MLYTAVEASAHLRMPWIFVAESLEKAFPSNTTSTMLRNIGALCSVFVRLHVTHARPEFGIDSVEVNGAEIAVVEEILFNHPWCNLLHFKKDTPHPGPRVIIVAPLSGHFATLVRKTVRIFLPDFDVFVTDWKNAREIPLVNGALGLDANISVLIRFLEFLGPEVHIVAVCQSSVTVSAAVSILAEGTPRAAPRSMIKIAGPDDTRINPTAVNKFAKSYPIEWFERTLITRVPFHLPGCLRPVYPGFLQLGGFMSMNLERHMKAHLDLYRFAANGDEDEAETIRLFYDEYRAVIDLPAEFYLETVQTIFHEHRLPKGDFTWCNQKIDPNAVTSTALMTIEGEEDDICGIGQTSAAHDLFTRIPNDMRAHQLVPGAGHYSAFGGKKFKEIAYPKAQLFIMRHAT